MSSCFPFGRDYQPVSINKLCDENLKSIASSCMDLDSEFLFMVSPSVGCVGNFPRENFFRYGPDNVFYIGFLMLFGFSEKLEKAIIISLAMHMKIDTKLLAGVSNCSFWRSGIFEGRAKVIAITSDEPFYDGSEYIKNLAEALVLTKQAMKTSDLSYYAEKFGYDRFFARWENQKTYDARISKLIAEFKYNETKELLGGSTQIDLPSFIGVTIRAE